MGGQSKSSDPIRSLVRQVRARLFVRGWISWTLRSLFVASVASLLWVVASRLMPALGDPFWPVIAALAASYPVGFLIAVLRRPSEDDAAVTADRAFGLRERVTTALELADNASPMAQAARDDARRKVEGARPSHAVPLAIGARARWVYAPLLALGVAYLFLPELDLFDYNARQAEADARREAVAVHVERIKEALDPLKEENATGEPSPLSDITAQLSDLANQMDSGQLTEKQAIAKLDNLAEKVEEQRRQLAEKGMLPQLANDAERFGMARDVAKALQEGKLADAAKKLAELQKKLQDGSLSKSERESLAKSLQKLAEAMAANPSAMSESLAEALAKAAASMTSGDMKAAGESMKLAELSLKDIESMMAQLDKMSSMKAYLAEWKGNMMGASEYCRSCGMKMSECTGGSCCTPGNGQCNGAGGGCSNGSCNGNGLGLRGAGRGAGNRIGNVPEIEAGFQPTQAPGPLTKGKMLADLLQRSAPEEGEESKVDYINGTFEQLAQDAEQALTQEEIPAGAKEYVRQYFGAIEPEKTQP